MPPEVMVSDNRASFFQSDASFKGKPVAIRQVVNVPELCRRAARKAINKDSLAEEVSSEDKERILAFIWSFGALAKDGSYGGSARAGYSEAPAPGLQSGD